LIVSARSQGRSDSTAEDPAVVRIEKLVGGGRGLAHNDGETWFVAGALPGEEVSALPTRRRAGIVEAATIAVHGDTHPARVDDPCPHADICGGCDWPNVDPETGAELKVEAAAEAARFEPDLAAAIAGSTIRRSPPASRIRARLHWDPTDRRLGFYEYRSHRVATIAGCRILSPQLMQALPAIERSLARREVPSVDLEWLEGSDPRSAVAALRRSKSGPAAIRPEWIPDESDAGAHIAGFHCLEKNGEARLGWGVSSVRFDLPIPLEVPIGAFFQGNRHLLAPLFSRVAQLAGSDDAPAFDLHAGVGFLAAAARSTSARPLTLVEPHRGAARAAQKNLPDADVRIGVTAEEFLSAPRFAFRDVLVITDPPRRGMGKLQLRGLASWRPRRLLMLGCDPATWTRDAAFLVGQGYRLIEIELFDLFPHTHHVEILATMEHS
jgi:23S rRNA (uracil1939-C5)-methyltransferase